MKLITYITLVVALAFLVGCATTFRPWKLSEVEDGMDRAQVVRILGEPNSVETKDGAEFLTYTYSEDYNPYLADNSPRKMDSPSLHTYSVKLVDGAVQDYKEHSE